MAKSDKLIKFTHFFFSKAHLIVVLFALLFTFLNRYAIYFPWIIPEQEKITQATRIKKELQPGESKARQDFIATNFLLINVAHDADIYCDPAAGDNICGPDSSGNRSKPCFATINRKKLAACLKWLLDNKNEYNLVICDIVFQDRDTSLHDNDSLQYYFASLQQANKIIFGGQYNSTESRFDKSNFSKVIDDRNTGAINEDLTDNLFLTYKLSYDHAKAKSLPLLMYERIYKREIGQSYWGLLKYSNTAGNKVSGVNVFIPEMIFSCKDFDALRSLHLNDNPDSTIVKMDLWEATRKCGAIDNFYLRRALTISGEKKRNVFIGAFSHDHADMHKTLYENTDGSIILLNIYYNLVKGQNAINTIHFLFLLACFYLIFIRIFIHPHNPYKGTNKLITILTDWFFNEFHYIILILMTVISNLCFNKVTNVIVLVVVFYLLTKGISFYKEHFSRKKPAV